MKEKIEFEIKNPNLKAFVENEKVYKTVIGIMFVLSSIAVSEKIAESCHSVEATGDSILFMNIIWIGFYIICSLIHIRQIGFVPATFAVSAYFVADYFLGNILSKHYTASPLPITKTIGLLFVFVIAAMCFWLKRLDSKGSILNINKELKSTTVLFLDSCFMLFFGAGGLLLGEIVLIVDVFTAFQFGLIAEIVAYIITGAYLIILIPVYGTHFKMGKNMFYSFYSFMIIIATYILGTGKEILPKSEGIAAAFWYQLLDALKIIK